MASDCFGVAVGATVIMTALEYAEKMRSPVPIVASRSLQNNDFAHGIANANRPQSNRKFVVKKWHP